MIFLFRPISEKLISFGNQSGSLWIAKRVLFVFYVCIFLQLKMHNVDSEEFLKFKFDRLLSRQLDDGATARELPAIRPGDYLLPG